MPQATTALLEKLQSPTSAVSEEARRGLSSTPKTLSPWLFYDETGSQLFEQITTLPEYYLTRTERDLFTTYGEEMFREFTKRLGVAERGNAAVSAPYRGQITIAELGAGTASKTGVLLRALTHTQPTVLYQPIDISPTALEEARTQLELTIPGVTVKPCVANYVTDPFRIERAPRSRVLTLYIGSSIGNFTPEEARAILTRLRSQLRPGDALLLGTDLAPSFTGSTVDKRVATLLAAYNDTRGVTAAFNRNVLTRLNRDLGANFRPGLFAHRAVWNAGQSRMEMHLESIVPQTVTIPANASGRALGIDFTAGETIHTENSYKFTSESIAAMLNDARFTPTRTFTDPQNLFAVTLASAT